MREKGELSTTGEANCVGEISDLKNKSGRRTEMRPTPSDMRPTSSGLRPTPSKEHPTPSKDRPTPSKEHPIPSKERPIPSYYCGIRFNGFLHNSNRSPIISRYDNHERIKRKDVLNTLVSMTMSYVSMIKGNGPTNNQRTNIGTHGRN